MSYLNFTGSYKKKECSFLKFRSYSHVIGCSKNSSLGKSNDYCISSFYRTELIARGRKDSPAFRKQVVRVLKELEEQSRGDFKRLRCSYYAGDDSKVSGDHHTWQSYSTVS